MKRDAFIFATLGPASVQEDVLIKMAKAGMNVARLNCSHGSLEEHQKKIDVIRHINCKYAFGIKILLDLEGFRIRIGQLDKPLELKKGQKWQMSNSVKEFDVIPFDFAGDIKTIKKNLLMFVDDGNICFRIKGYRGQSLELEVLQPGILKTRKGINIPGVSLSDNIMTARDRHHIKFGLKHKVDFIAQSFVRNREDIVHVNKLVKPSLPQCQVIAKIESEEAIKNVDEIIEACDGIMVARGDLGVSLPIYKIPIFQKYIIRRCNRRKKYVITATQMLESMTDHNRPTRAEVSDVANAILDGTDAVMLSGETAVGQYPVETIDMMRKIIDFTEQSQRITV